MQTTYQFAAKNDVRRDKDGCRRTYEEMVRSHELTNGLDRCDHEEKKERYRPTDGPDAGLMEGIKVWLNGVK